MTTALDSPVIDLLFKLIGILLASTAIFQLYEAKTRRMVETYWKIAEDYLSEENQDRRTAIDKIQEWFDKEKEQYKDIESLDLWLDSRLTNSYIQRFHDAEDGSPEKKLDVKARHNIRFLNQVSILVKKDLIDKYSNEGYPRRT
jgi:hypothetical protein